MNDTIFGFSRETFALGLMVGIMAATLLLFGATVGAFASEQSVPNTLPAPIGEGGGE